MEDSTIAATGVAALLFSTTFIAGKHFHPLSALIHDRRVVISFSAGMSAAYVFVHLMPELQGARRALAASATTLLRFEGASIYLFALLGFLSFYGLEHLRARLRSATDADQSALAFRLHIGGFAAYAWLVAYLLVRNLEETPTSTALYAVAIIFHFLTVDHSLRTEHGVAYERYGRFILAATSALGWASGLLFGLPGFVLAILVAFVSGAIIINSSIMELPSEKDGRFVPFLVGGLVYGLILLPLG